MKWLRKLIGRHRRPPAPRWSLSRTVLPLSNGTGLSLADLCRGCLVTGAIGGGKTSGPMDALTLALMRFDAGMVLTTARPGDFDHILAHARRVRREKDVIRFAPGEPHKFDFLSWEMQPRDGSNSENGSSLLDLLVDVVVRQKGKDSDGAYWAETTAKATRMGLMLLQLAYGTATIPALYTLATDATGGFAEQVIAKAKENGANEHDLLLLAGFWRREWKELSDKTKSIIVSMLTNTLSPFLPSQISSLVASGVSTVTPADVLAGKIVVVDMPVVTWRLTAQLVGAVWRVLVQRECLRRRGADNPRPVACIVDESQYYALPDHDVLTQTISRECRLVNIYAVQNLPVLTHAFGGQDRRSAVEAWIANLAIKLICANSCNDTNRFFAETFGHTKKTFFSGGTQGGPVDFIGDALGIAQPRTNASFSEQWQYHVDPAEFGRLATGGYDSDPPLTVEAYLHLGGKRLPNGKPFQKVWFRQGA